MFVIPAKDLNFRDPHTHQRVPPEGMEVPDSSLEWARIIADGSATVGEAPAEPASEPAPKAKRAAASEEG